MMYCSFCGKEKEEFRNTGYCSKSCYDKAYYRSRVQCEKICKECGKDYIGSSKRNNYCPSCHAILSGESRNKPLEIIKPELVVLFQLGYGKDKKGLDWKKQRRLCWERDGYACQYDGCDMVGSPEGTKPDCHHIVKFRISGSHELSNLISYCRHHHRVVEFSSVDYASAVG